MSVVSETVLITPERAEVILGSNRNNRKVRTGVVDRYSRDMAQDAWRLNGEAIKVGLDGSLLDGQHRLLACVQAGVAFRTVLVTGLSVETKSTMDTGVKRSFGDVLRWQGEVDVSSLAAAIESGLCWDERGYPSSSGATHSNHERLVWLETNPDIREAVRRWGTLRTAPLRAPVSMGGPFAMRIFRLSPGDAETFLDLFHTGDGLHVHDPIFRLRSWMMNAAVDKRVYPREEYAAICVKAWNAWIEGREVRQLSWKRGGAQKEAFPKLLTGDGRTYEEIMNTPTLPEPEVQTPDFPGTFLQAPTEQAV